MRYIIILVIIAVGVFDAASHTVESQLYVDNMSLEDGLSINALFYDVDTDKLWIGSKKGLTGISGNEFIRRIRLKRGKELLVEGCNVSEAAIHVDSTMWDISGIVSRTNMGCRHLNLSRKK